MRQLDRSPFGRIEGMAWSFDSRWVAYGYVNTRRRRPSSWARSSQARPLSPPVDAFEIRGPRFDPEGKYLYFVGQRDFDPVYDELHFDLGFPKGSRPFAITLRKDLDNPFIPRRKPPESQEVTALKKAEAEEGPPAPHASRSSSTALSIACWPFRSGRRASVASRASRARCSSRRTRSKARGVAPGQTRNTPARARSRPTIWRTQKQDRLVDGISDLSVARWQGAAVSGGGRLRVLKAGEKSTRKEGRQAWPRKRLDRPGSRQSVRFSRPPSGNKCSRRPGVCSASSSGPKISRARLGRRQSAVPAADRARDDAVRVFGPAVGAPGRTGHVARL